MTAPRILVLSALLGLGGLSDFSSAQTFVVGDRAATVTNANIKDDTASAGASLAAGESFSFQGNVNVGAAVGVFIDPVLSGLTFTVESGATISADGPGFLLSGPAAFDGVFTNNGTISSVFSDGVLSGPLTGTLINNGTISGLVGIAIIGDLSGLLVNSGSISGDPAFGFAGVYVDESITGIFRNTGTITGPSEGVFVSNDISGRFENHGTIVSRFGDGVSTFDLSGSLVNSGTITADIDGVYVENDLTGSFRNSGMITGGADGVFIEDDLEGFFENTGTIIGLNQDGVDVDDNFTGTFINRGTIEGRGSSHEGFEVDGLFSGTATNYGTIRGADDGVDLGAVLPSGLFINRGSIIGSDDGFDGDGDFAGRIENYSLIQGAVDGIDIDGTFSGSTFNCGVIEGSQFGFIVSPGAAGTGIFHNHGGRVQGELGAISMQDGNGTVILSGPSHIVGSIDGGAGTGDVLRFQNMRGVSAAKEAELLALASSDPNAGAVTLFGETINWLNIEDIQADGSTLDSYERLFSGTGLGGYGNALDNLNGLDDDLRNFLKSLNDISESALNGAASNSSGQTLRNSMADLRRERDTNFFHLFSNQFSSLRGDVSGGSPDVAVRSEGFLSREIEIGATIQVADPAVDTWVTSYVGSGKQDGNAVRAAADYDQTSILFGRGQEWSDEMWLGWFGGYSRSQGQVDSFGSYLENDGGWFGLNAQLRRGDAFANLVGGVGFQDIETNRIDFLGSVHEGDTEAFGAFFYSQFGKDFAFGEEGKGKWTPYAGFTYGGDSISGYSENGPAGSSLRFQDDTETVFQTVLGVSASGYGETKKGWFRPRADLAWWHAYGEDSFGAGLANSTLLNSFSVINPDANENRGVFQVGVEFGLDCLEDWTFEAGYFGVVGGDDYRSHGGTVGARVEF